MSSTFEIALVAALVANALAVVVGIWLGTRRITSKIDKVAVVANGMKDELVEASHQRGIGVGEARARAAAAAALLAEATKES